MRTYLQMQFRRLFGLNITPIEPLLFVGGQFRANQWPELHRMGVRVVLSMQGEREDRFSEPLPIISHRLVVTDFFAPSLDQIVEGIQFVRAAHDQGHPVLIHCRAGVGRAPLMAAAYLMAKYDIDHKEALRQLRRARPIISPNLHQLARLREFEAQRPDRRVV